MKKWYLSKTILVAMAMEALAQVTVHMEEVKTAIASHTNTDAGLAFAIAFPAVMVLMRFITTKPIEGVAKNVQGSNERSDRADQNMDNRDDDDWDDDNGVVGILPKPISDSGAQVGERKTCEREEILRDVTKRSKRAHRGKRRR